MPSPELETIPLRVLLVEDNADDAALVELHLQRNAIAANVVRVETATEMLTALQGLSLPDLILADYNLPAFSGPAALGLLKSQGLDIPFIMLSGAVSEETAVSSMRAGAQDYVSKQNLSRLAPAIRRELQEAQTRRNRLAAEGALRASEARFHALVEAMPMGLLISDAQGHITYANRAAELLLEYPERSLSSDALELSEALELSAICPAMAETGAQLAAGALKAEPFEAVCTTRSGSPVEVLIGVAALDEEAAPEKRQLASFIADLTQQKKGEEALRRTEKLAIVGRLAASIAHEINNPLEATINCLYLVSQMQLPEQARTYLDMAQKELDRVTQITVQTLRFYRASTRPALTDVHELIGTVLSLHDSRLRALQIEVRRDLRGNSSVYIHDGEIRQVLANLIGNAIDAVGEGGRIVVRTAPGRDWQQGRVGIVITVADDGMGMDKATCKRIFEPFFSTKGTMGTGLGLWVSDEIVRKHHGRIQIRSRQAGEGQSSGTVFRIFLPKREESMSPEVQMDLVRSGHR